MRSILDRKTSFPAPCNKAGDRDPSLRNVQQEPPINSSTKRKQSSLEEIVLTEQIKRFRISNTPGELRLQKDLKDLVGRDEIEFSYPDDPASVIIRFCDQMENAPSVFRVTVPRFYPHVKPAVYCMNGESFTCPFIEPTSGEVVHPELNENWSAVGTLANILDVVQSVRLMLQESSSVDKDIPVETNSVAAGTMTINSVFYNQDHDLRPPPSLSLSSHFSSSSSMIIESEKSHDSDIGSLLLPNEFEPLQHHTYRTAHAAGTGFISGEGVLGEQGLASPLGISGGELFDTYMTVPTQEVMSTHMQIPPHSVVVAAAAAGGGWGGVKCTSTPGSGRSGGIYSFPSSSGSSGPHSPSGNIHIPLILTGISSSMYYTTTQTAGSSSGSSLVATNNHFGEGGALPPQPLVVGAGAAAVSSRYPATTTTTTAIGDYHNSTSAVATGGSGSQQASPIIPITGISMFAQVQLPTPVQSIQGLQTVQAVQWGGDGHEMVSDDGGDDDEGDDDNETDDSGSAMIQHEP